MTSSNELTIADVARTAGVSISTVSRVLNGKQDVGAETRLRVQETIDHLGYRPHAPAKSLRGRKTHTLALLYPLSVVGQPQLNQLELELLMGAAQIAGNNHFSLNVITQAVSEPDLINLYRSSQVDGVILMQIHLQDWRVDLLRKMSLPFAIVGHCEDNTGVNFIDFDFEAAVQAEFAHLIELGHRRIGFLMFPNRTIANGYGPGVRALAGYKRVLVQHGIESLMREVDFSVDAVYSATLELLDQSPDLTAIVTTADISTVGALRAAAVRGLRVPDDVSVVTWIPEFMSNLTNPPLTGPDFPSLFMGGRAAEMLIRKLEKPDAAPEQILLPPHMVIRESSGPVRMR